MNRDTTIIQVAILMIALAILGVAIWRQQQPATIVKTTTPVKVQEQIRSDNDELVMQVSGSITKTNTGTGVNVNANSRLTERENPDRANLVKQYFAHLQAKEFKQACGLLTSGKCSAIRQAAVDAFSQEFLKLKNGYEYINVKDFGFQSPSGKDVVCVKYSYRYKGDTNPGLTSEILSFYIDEDVGKRVITDRVCEKKYKEGSGTRSCPVQATQDFCVGKIK